MKFLHVVNAAAWAANALVWFAYAHVPAMAIASLLATVTALWMARAEGQR